MKYGKNKKTDLNPGKGIFDQFKNNIDEESKLFRINNKNHKQDEICIPKSKNVNCIEDVHLNNRSYPKIGINNSYPSDNLPNGIANCNRNMCMNSVPFNKCINKEKFEYSQNSRKNWKQYSEIHNMNENMQKDIRFYADRNTYPFVLNHVAVAKDIKCYDDRCEDLFNNVTNANLIDGRNIYNKMINLI